VRVRLIALCAVALLGVGCSRMLDTAGLEEQIQQLLAERGNLQVERVDCPDDVTVEAGATFRCVAVGDGAEWTIEVTQVDDEGRVDWQIVDAA
jgi:hypothetical protein